MAKVNCDYCGTEFNKEPNKISKHKHNFCCSEHYFMWNTKENHHQFNKPLPDHVKEAARQYHLGRTTSDLQKQKAREHFTGKKYRLDIPPTNKLYNVNSDYFKEIDTEEKAYWLGFLLADSNIICKDGKYICVLNIIDLDHLNKFRNAISYTGSIKTIKDHFYVLSIRDKYFVLNLIDKGVVPNKTFKVVYPEKVPIELYNHFIRGYWDGDGCIYFTKDKHYFGVSLIGTYLFIEAVTNIISTSCSLKSKSFYKRKKIWILNRSANQALKICEYLYLNASVFLERKYNKYIQYLQSKEVKHHVSL